MEGYVHIRCCYWPRTGFEYALQSITKGETVSLNTESESRDPKKASQSAAGWVAPSSYFPLAASGTRDIWGPVFTRTQIFSNKEIWDREWGTHTWTSLHYLQQYPNAGFASLQLYMQLYLLHHLLSWSWTPSERDVKIRITGHFALSIYLAELCQWVVLLDRYLWQAHEKQAGLQLYTRCHFHLT